MFWREESDKQQEYRVPDDIFDLIFRLRGTSLDIDHAYALAQALREHLDADTCARIGVLGVRLPGSGNGWNPPQESGAELPLSRRARLVIRVHRDDRDAVTRISDRRLQVGRQPVEVGGSSVRLLSSLGTVYSRAVACDPRQSEDEFLLQVADELRRQADAFVDLLDLQEQIERELPRDHPRARSETEFADEDEADFEEDEEFYESGTG